LPTATHDWPQTHDQSPSGTPASFKRVVHAVTTVALHPVVVVHRFCFVFIITFIQPQGASHGELDQPSPQSQADRPQSVKVYGRIEGHSVLLLILLHVMVWRLLPFVVQCIDTFLSPTLPHRRYPPRSPSTSTAEHLGPGRQVVLAGGVENGHGDCRAGPTCNIHARRGKSGKYTTSSSV